MGDPHPNTLDPTVCFYFGVVPASCFQGALHLETWLMSAPVDLPALKLAQDAHLTLGDSANMRDCVGRVLPFWSEGDP